jgi:signal transduction histidine kinase
MLDDFGLFATMEWQAQEWSERTGIPIQLDLPRGADMSLNDKTRTAVFRVFQESLTNIARHAHATRVDVATTVEDAFIALRVQDNGNGMRPEALQNSASLGLIGMRERMREVGGDVEISSELGKGTTVVIRVPAG